MSGKRSWGSLPAVATVLKWLLGAFFVFSALSKFVDIDLLNVYIFSFNILSLNVSIVAAWILISVEIVVGVMLLSNKYHRPACLCSLILLIGFSAFLVYAHHTGRTDSCHCFGELLPFDPVQSLIKNIVLILIVLFVLKYANRNIRMHWWLSLLGVVIALGIVVVSGFLGWRTMTFIDLQYTATLALCIMVMAVVVSLPVIERLWAKILVGLTPVVAIFVLAVAVHWMHNSADNPTNYEAFQTAIAPEGELGVASLSEGRHVVSFYSKTCSYCKMASAKVSAIQKRNNLEESLFLTVFPGTDTAGIGAFYENGASRYSEYLISKETYVGITYGQFPLILFVDNGKIVDTYSHGDISENALVEFLKEL